MTSSAHVWLKNTTELVGTVSADDGVESLKISLTGGSADSEWKSVTVSGSAFRYDLKNFYSGNDDAKNEAANGPKTV